MTEEAKKIPLNIEISERRLCELSWAELEALEMYVYGMSKRAGLARIVVMKFLTDGNGNYLEPDEARRVMDKVKPWPLLNDIQKMVADAYQEVTLPKASETKS